MLVLKGCFPFELVLLFHFHGWHGVVLVSEAPTHHEFPERIMQPQHPSENMSYKETRPYFSWEIRVV